ncbi:MAG: hypothetical protein A2X86_21520 [Bdellovibrionales bacterium GWA2_49_15]|nr:MAG: hypothetical protein A2X86_21520 [Bdellovibrionales bacterium GWA2_49_15]HAZ14960.1 hypothetical protein [Bdellovibrionales bacterium]
MTNALKRTFYPAPEVEAVLKDAPVKKLSDRVNELILKGLEKEREEKIKIEYERYDQELSLAPKRERDKRGISATMIMSQGLFTRAEDEDGSDQDLI